MEDKELQELFDAKRWQEENLRQQEAIAATIGGRRASWPWWAGAAAAVLAAVLLAPALFGKQGELVAQTDAPISLKNNIKDSTEPAQPIPDRHTPPSTLRVSTPSSLEGELADAAIAAPTLPLDDTSDGTFETATPSTQSVDAPRIHRRRSDRLAVVDNLAERPKAPTFIAHYVNLPDSVNIAKNIIAKF